MSATATATAPAPNAATPAPSPAPAALWPANNRIEIIGLTGEYASGKTLFGLTIDPRSTLIFDMEKSAGSYLGLGFTRIDMGEQLLRRYPAGYKPKQAFEWWLDAIRRVQPGAYRVIMLDPISEVEAGLTDWVEDNPSFFGHTKQQYERMAGLFWADVKEYWKLILTDLASRCETFAFTSHMGNVWEGSAPVKGKRKPKGKETLMELASLYLHLERKADDKGNVPGKPSAIVLKSRLASTRLNPDTGDVEIVPTLPPRLPVATPAEIRKYMLAPPNYDKLKAGERIPEQRLSDDERLQLQTAKAQAEAEAERLRMERTGSMADAAKRHEAMVAAAAAVAGQGVGAPTAPQAAVTPAPSANGTHSTPTQPAASSPPSPPPPADPAGPPTDEQLQFLAQLRTHLFASREGTINTDAGKQELWRAELARYGVDSAKRLTAQQCSEFIADLRSRVMPF